ncbi:imidazolonepropionase [Acidobacteriota bacterium]
MIDADLIVEGIGELVTCAGNAPRVGKSMRETGVIENAVIAGCGGRLVAVGPEDQVSGTLRLRPDGVRINAAGRTVLPGFVDSHTHLAFGGTREDEFNRILQGESYLDIAASGGGIIRTVLSTRKAGFDELYAISKIFLDKMLRHGTTTAEAKSGYGLDLDTEIRQLEVIRALDTSHPVELVPTFLGAHIIAPEYRDDREGYISLLTKRMIPEVASRGLAKFCDVFCEEGVYTVEESRAILECGASYGLRSKIHADEFTDQGGAELAAELNAVSADHLSFISEKGLREMARAGVTAILLPSTTFFLRKDNYAPARKMMEAGVPVAVATDFNPGSSMTYSMQAILWLACLKLGMTIDEAITASTINAAYAVGKSSVVGSIEADKQADLVIFDIPNRFHLVYQWGTNHIGMVIKQGKVVYRDQSFPGKVTAPAGSPEPDETERSE